MGKGLKCTDYGLQLLFREYHHLACNVVVLVSVFPITAGERTLPNRVVSL